MSLWDLLEKYIGHKERKLGAVLLVAFGGLTITSFTYGWFPFMDSFVEGFPFLSVRNLLGILLIIVAIGWWKNRIG